MTTPANRTGEAKNMTRDDVMRETVKHVRRVADLMLEVTTALQKRAIHHDDSKFSPEEFDDFARETPGLKALTYGSAEYKAALERLGPALAHHYKANRHHPEHHPDGIRRMDLLDLIEMLCDWQAATERHADGSLPKSIAGNAKRFGYDDEFARLLTRTAANLGWFTEPEWQAMPIVPTVHQPLKIERACNADDGCISAGSSLAGLNPDAVKGLVEAAQQVTRAQHVMANVAPELKAAAREAVDDAIEALEFSLTALKGQHAKVTEAEQSKPTAEQMIEAVSLLVKPMHGIEFAEEPEHYDHHRTEVSKVVAHLIAQRDAARREAEGADRFTRLADDAHAWQLATFPKATPLSKAIHLKKEAGELLDDLTTDPTKTREMADILLLLIGIAQVTGTDLLAITEAKLAENKLRKWGKPDANGVVEHIRDAAAEAAKEKP